VLTLLVGCAFAIVSWPTASTTFAQQAPQEVPSADQDLDESLLQHGEFVAALARAEDEKDESKRDQALAAVAKRQAESGARPAAVRTALSIRSDLVQATTLHQIINANPNGNFGNFRNGGNFGVRGNPGNRMGNGFGNAGGVQNPFGNPGGGSQADFSSLIQLITTTVAPESWEEVGGTGTIAGFPGGVLIDATGLMRPMRDDRLRQVDVEQAVDDGDMVRVSLPRLEAVLLERRALGLRPTDEMLTLGGLARVEYLLVYPEAHDVVLVGPKATNPDSLSLGRLSDLAVALHQMFVGDGRMVCSITPRQRNLAATQDFIRESNQTPLRRGQRNSWLKSLQTRMGRQDIVFEGVAPDTHTAHVLVAADYHMKLIGMGLRDGVPGVVSYLDTLEIQPDGTVPPMDVLRWWFTLAKEPILTNADRNIFRLPESVVRVQSENEMLSERGARVPTGRSEPLNRRFAESFTRHFDELANRYPIYQELRDVFEFSMIAAELVDEGIPDKIEWHPTLLTSMDAYIVPRMEVPVEVETIVNHRVLQGKHIIAGVSGGVDLAARRDMPPVGVDLVEGYELDITYRGSAADDRHASYDDTVRWTW